MFGMLLTIIAVMVFDIKIFQNTFFKDYWISFIWIGLLSIIIFLVRFFPKTKWAKWWDGKAFFNKMTD